MRNERKGFELVSWYALLLGTIIVWVINSIQPVMDAISAHRPLLMAFLADVFIAVALYKVVWKKQRDYKTWIELILLASFLLQAGAVLVMRYNISGHDMGKFSDFDPEKITSGHLGYIDYIYKYHHLPDASSINRWSFSNPPGFYLMGAAVLGISRLFGVDVPLCYESIQMVTLFFSNLTVLAMYRILEEFSIKGKTLVLLTALLAFHPFFLIMAITANNDCMMGSLMALSVLGAIRWWKNPTLKNILLIALTLGLAMLTKLNAATLSVGIGALFLCGFWANRKHWRRYLEQFALFLMNCAVLGLFWPIRNVAFDRSPLFIQTLSPINSADQYIPGLSLLARLGLPSFEQWAYPFAKFDPSVEYNIWIQTLRTSLFDEFVPKDFYALPTMLLWTSMLLCVVMNALLAWSLWKKGTMHWNIKLFLVLIYAVMLGTYVKFCLDETFICTMNYRYIPIAFLFPCIGTGLFLQRPMEAEGETKRRGTVFDFFTRAAIVQFIVLAVIMDGYMVMQFVK